MRRADLELPELDAGDNLEPYSEHQSRHAPALGRMNGSSHLITTYQRQRARTKVLDPVPRRVKADRFKPRRPFLLPRKAGLRESSLVAQIEFESATCLLPVLGRGMIRPPRRGSNVHSQKSQNPDTTALSGPDGEQPGRKRVHFAHTRAFWKHFQLVE